MAEIFRKRSVVCSGSGFDWRGVLLCHVLALSVSPLLALSAMAQTTPSIPASSNVRSDNLGGTTILPTDVVPLADRDAYKTPFGELMQLKLMQRLPSQLYFSSSVEVTGRNETNPFQFPLKRTLLSQLPKPAIWRQLNEFQQADLYNILGQVARNNMIFRALPNVSGGWALTPHTRLFTNYFMIRDQLAHSMRLNTVIESWALGLQHDMPVGAKGSLQFEIQGRELWQLHQQSVFDFLPGITASYIATPRTVIFVNALVQARGKAPLQAPTKELDPFFTWGGLYQKNGWTFSASSTFVQNFREPFHHNATIPKNSYVIISDYEIARRIVKQYPGLQAFMRVEPIWNFHSHSIPSLSGMDFRLFFGMRFAMAKPALTTTLQQIREQLKQDGGETPSPSEKGKPSASNPPEELISLNPQPIHGFLAKDSLAETCQNPYGEMPVIAEDTDENGNSTLVADAPDKSVGGRALASSDAPDTPAQTLDTIAKSNGLGEAAPDKNNANILDLSTAKLDWKDLETAANPTTAIETGNQAELHSIVDQAASTTNSLALQDRSQKIQTLSEKNEKEFKLAYAAPLPPVAPKPALVPKLEFKKTAESNVSVFKKTIESPLAATVPQQLATLKPEPKRTLVAPQASGLTPATSLAQGQPSSKAHLDTNLAFVQNVQTPQLNSGNKILQPLERSGSQSYSSNLPPSSINLTKKIETTSPVPMTIKAAAAPNMVPAPVNAKQQVTTGVVPVASGKAEAPKAVEVVHHIANKDGSIPVTEAKLDKLSEHQFAPKLAQKQALATTQVAQEKVQVIASANIPQLSNSAIPPKPIKALSDKSLASAPKQFPRPVLELKPVSAAPVADENAIAVSSLSENDISSPKIAMAVYESWQSPVIDDPLIGGDISSGTQALKFNNESSAAELSDKKHKDTEKKRTDMHLIPPFPTTMPGAKDNPIKDLKIPVLPVH